MDTIYNTDEYKANIGFIYLWISLILIIFFSIFIGRQLNISAFIAIPWIISLFILPFVFEKSIKQLFTKSVQLEFNDSSFSISKYSSKNKLLSYKENINWVDIKSYKFYFTSSKNTILTLYLKNGKTKRWVFKDNRSYEEASKEESLFSICYSYIKKFNTNKNVNEKIELNRGFLNSKIGSIIIYSEIIVIVVAFVFHVMIQPKSSFLTMLMGISLVIQLFVKRKHELELYNKISALS